jgi:hypothetical protein
MQAQRARGREAVKSYERQRALVYHAVCGHELTLEEPHIGMEPIRRSCAGIQVRSCSRKEQVRLTDDPIEVRNLRRVVTRNLDLRPLLDRERNGEWLYQREWQSCAEWARAARGMPGAPLPR